MTSMFQVIHQKLTVHDGEAQRILAKEPPLKETVLASMQRLEESWRILTETAEQRHNKLERSHQLYKYIDSVKKVGCSHTLNCLKRSLSTLSVKL